MDITLSISFKYFDLEKHILIMYIPNSRFLGSLHQVIENTILMIFQESLKVSIVTRSLSTTRTIAKRDTMFS